MNLSGQDYAFVQRLVLERTAIVIGDDQHYLVRSRLEAVARKVGVASLRALVQRLRSEPSGSLHTLVVEAMTTNETSFFRDGHPFDALQKQVLPELFARRTPGKPIAIWSAACATGQEAYSIAMLVAEHFPQALGEVKILASDLSSVALAKAKAGRYSSLEIGRGLPARMLAQYFRRDGALFEVQPELRGMIEWEQRNLARSWSLQARFDVVFLRNVLIYFKPETAAAVLGAVRKVLASDGYLFLGSAEKIPPALPGFTAIPIDRTLAYRPVKLERG